MTRSGENGLQSIVLGGGCFWCLEAAYQMVKGVNKVTSGYAGGHWPDPTYERVTSGTTGHAEVVKVEFDPGQITLDTILDIFWTIHDPTTKDRQGHDIGTQYRSVILYSGDRQKRIAEASRDAAQDLVEDPIVTEIKPLDNFYAAEAYHQNYFRNNPEQGYCQVVINPKLTKLKAKHAPLLKENA